MLIYVMRLKPFFLLRFWRSEHISLSPNATMAKEKEVSHPLGAAAGGRRVPRWWSNLPLFPLFLLPLLLHVLLPLLFPLCLSGGCSCPPVSSEDPTQEEIAYLRRSYRKRKLDFSLPMLCAFILTKTIT